MDPQKIHCENKEAYCRLGKNIHNAYKYIKDMYLFIFINNLCNKLYILYIYNCVNM